MFELWIYEARRAQRVTAARHIHTLRTMWRVHRDAVIAQGGVIVDRKPHLDPVALREIARALTAAPVAAEVSPEHRGDASSEVAADDDGTVRDDCPAPIVAEVEHAAAEEADQEDEPRAEPAAPLTAPVPTAPAPVSATPACCAARGCIGAVGPGPASPELADFCIGHRGVVIRAARRLGTPHPDAARALRLHGQVTRATVSLSRAA